MNSILNERINTTLELLKELREDQKFGDKVELCVTAMVNSLKLEKPLLVCGNGGSSSDAMHIAGELVGRFLQERRACNVIALSANTSVLTAWANDYSYDTIFSRQVEAHGSEKALLWGISTSGNSQNVVNALKTAKKMEMVTVGLTGAGGGKMEPYCDILLDVPSTVTPRIQELHIVIYHYVCECVEKALSL